MDGLSILNAARSGQGAAGLAPPRPTSPDEAAAREAAEAFAGQFLGQMFNLAMQEMPVDEVFGGGPGEKMFRGMLTEAWAEGAVKNGGVGIADAVMREILIMQGEQGK